MMTGTDAHFTLIPKTTMIEQINSANITGKLAEFPKPIRSGKLFLC